MRDRGGRYGIRRGGEGEEETGFIVTRGGKDTGVVYD